MHDLLRSDLFFIVYGTLRFREMSFTGWCGTLVVLDPLRCNTVSATTQAWNDGQASVTTLV